MTRGEPPATPLALADHVTNGRWIKAPHLALLDEALVHLESRRAPAGFLRRLGATSRIPDDVDDATELPFVRLVIEMPPRHGKSEQTSRYFTAWYLGKNPTHHVILTSYEAEYARSWGRKSRDVLERFGEECFDVKVSRNTSAANDWEIEGHGGGMITAGIGGAITGRGANLLVVDDPVKNAQEAASATIQERNVDWWRSTAYTRLEPDADGREGIVVLIQTRWHEADLTGRILSDEEGLEDEETWYILELPAIAEQNDILGRPPGAALWPARYDEARLERIRNRLGTYYWHALYQQRPTPEEGSIYKRGWWQYYDTLPAGKHTMGYSIIDTAGYDDKTTGDFAVIATVVRIGKDLYWLNVQRGHWEFPELVQRTMDARTEYDLPILIEETPWAKPLIQTLRSKVSGVVAFVIGGVNKTARAMAGSPFAEGGNFYLPRNAKWVPEFIEEHAAFPNGAHDDQVDTTSMAAIRLLLGSKLPSQQTVTMRNDLAPDRSNMLGGI